MDNLTEEVQKSNRLLKAVLLLSVREYQQQGDSSEKIELLLAASGLGYQDIAEILGKKPDAVRMLLKRKKQ